MSGWTDDLVATLKKMHADGESVSQIAATVGMTPGAVSGKLFRLGLCTPHDEQWGKGKAKRIKSRAQRMDTSNSGRMKREAAAAYLRAQFSCVEIVDLPPGQSAVAVKFLQLNDRTCRWPLGDPRQPDFVYCGAVPFEDRPYCERHTRIAYVPLGSRLPFMQAAV